LQDTGSAAFYCPCAAPTPVLFPVLMSSGLGHTAFVGAIVTCLFLVGRMQRFLQYRLGCHGLPIAAGCLAGTAHVGRADRVCLACNSGPVGDEKHLVFECTALLLCGLGMQACSCTALTP